MESPSDQTPHHQVATNSSNGHEIGFTEYGFKGGLPVLYFHGLPGSGFEAGLWDETAKALKLRLIAPDRPGMGRSTYDASRTLTDYPDDIAVLVNHLQLDAYFIMGVSGGGMYTLTCAASKAKLPGLQGVAVVAGLGPRNLTQQGMGLFQKLSFHAMDWIPAGIVEWLWDAMIGKTARNPDPKVLEQAVKKGGARAKGSDAEYYKDDNNVRRMTESLRGAFAQSSKGYVHEATILCKPWGFELGDIVDVPVRFWYGGKDELAPLATGKAMADSIPGAIFKGLEDETHIGIIMSHQKELLEELIRIKG